MQVADEMNREISNVKNVIMFSGVVFSFSSLSSTFYESEKSVRKAIVCLDIYISK